MKFLFLGLFLLTVTGVQAKPVDFDHANITFDAPDDFTPLTQDEIALKFPRRTGPMEAVGNDTRGVTICYSITSNAVQPDQLPQLKDAFSSMMTKLIPGLQWIRKDFVEINGTKWIILESTTPTTDQPVHNIELVTSYHGQMLAFNFNSTVVQFATYGDKLKASMNSIIIHNNGGDSAAPPPSSSPSTNAP